MDRRISDFINKGKSKLIAPAGYGKTHFLAECIKHTPQNSKQLILTHTHAGIASIKEKINKFSIPAKKYHIETISGFVQKYVLAFHCGEELKQEDNDYFSKVLDYSIPIFQHKAVLKIIAASHDGLFVDEYQDCTQKQHKVILSLSEVLPTHILGDPLQGIFGFNEPLVDFETDLKEFEEVAELDIPWRWKQGGNNDALGEALVSVRVKLLTQTSFDFPRVDKTIYLCHRDENDLNNPSSRYCRDLNRIISNQENDASLESLLILHPEYFDQRNIPKGDTKGRAKLRSRIDFTKQLRLLESFDNKDYYSLAKTIDEIVVSIYRKRKKVEFVKNQVLLKLFNKTDVDSWFGEDKVKKRRCEKEEPSLILSGLIESCVDTPSHLTFLNLILFVKNELKFKYQRPELVFTIIKALGVACENEEPVTEAMKRYKNIKRVQGRKVDGKYLGTTLLTKGLEFDTVVILNAHRYTNPKHLYVALTRAAKQVVIFTEKGTVGLNASIGV